MKLGRFVDVSEDEYSRRSGLTGKERFQKQMKALKSLTAIVAALAFLASVSFAADQSCCEKAKAAGVVKVAFDRSGFRYHGRIAALADAAREGGLKF